jgi:hypothetical protein
VFGDTIVANDTAELDTGAEMVQRDIERLNDLVFRFNSQAGSAR